MPIIWYSNLRENKLRWISLLWRADPHRHHPPKWIIKQAQRELDNYWPPATLPEKANQKWPPFGLRVMLLDRDKTIMFGREELIPQLRLYAIQYGFETVGYLGLLPGKPVSQASDIYFMERQANLFFWIALFMVLLSALIAWFLAYHLGRPLKRITAAAQRLAVGDYKARLPVESSDEMGNSRNFNDMVAALEQASNRVADGGI
ncbi:MAG: HAMP domain-containing protein [Nitrosomonas sp.]|nr:HAMP domain-containing protein [Nitrosomonas sp.]